MTKKTYTATSKTLAPRPRSKRLREVGGTTVQQTGGSSAVGEQLWTRVIQTLEGGDVDEHIEAQFPAQVVKSLTLVDENGTKVTLSLVDGRLYLDGSLVAKEDVVAYGMQESDVQTVKEYVESQIVANPEGQYTAVARTLKIGDTIYQIEGSGGGESGMTWGGFGTSEGNAVSNLEYNAATNVLSGTKAKFLAIEGTDPLGIKIKDGYISFYDGSQYIPMYGVYKANNKLVLDLGNTGYVSEFYGSAFDFYCANGGSAVKLLAIDRTNGLTSSGDVKAKDSSNNTHSLVAKADKATTLSGYGITDANIANGVITLGTNTITPLTSHQSLNTTEYTVESSEITSASVNILGRNIHNLHRAGHLVWTSGTTHRLITLGTLAYWDGQFDSSKSNLKYCLDGEICSKSVADTKINNAIDALDVDDSAVANQFVTMVKQVNGKIQVSKASLTSTNIAQAGKLSNATSGNADTATKLQTARSLWGNSFDGSSGVDGSIEIKATGNSYNEGIRIHSASNKWATIALCDSENQSASGTSANTWSISNNEGAFYINKNGSKTTTGNELCCVDAKWGVGTVSPSEKLAVNGSINISSVASSSRNWIKIGGVERMSNWASDMNATVFRGSKYSFDTNTGTTLASIEDNGSISVVNSSKNYSFACKPRSATSHACVVYCPNNQVAKKWLVGANTNGKFTWWNATSGDIDSGWSEKVNIDNSGNIVAAGDVTAYSDARLKSEIRPLEYRGALEPKEYIKDGKKSLGFIAQEVRELYPELVIGEEKEDEYLSLNYGAITAVLAAENKELRARIDSLEDKIAKMESMLNKLMEK